MITYVVFNKRKITSHHTKKENKNHIPTILEIVWNLRDQVINSTNFGKAFSKTNISLSGCRCKNAEYKKVLFKDPFMY